MTDLPPTNSPADLPADPPADPPTDPPAGPPIDQQMLAGLGALAEPIRRALYECVVASPEPLGREQAAATVGVAVHTAKFHLDRLVADGLLDVQFRRLSGRTGPGAGRPAKLYRRSAREFAISLPPRHYDLAGQILADAVERASAGAELDAALQAAAHDAAYRIVGGHQPATTAGTGAPERPDTELLRVLTELGYEPRTQASGLRLVNCPFHALAQRHTALVCGVNRAFVGELLAGLGRSDVQARLTPTPGQCCVTIAGAV